MGISISNATSSAITKYSVSLRSGEPDWSMIPSAGKSNKSQAEFVSEIKELAQRAANTTSKTELESIHRQRTRLCAEYNRWCVRESSFCRSFSVAASRIVCISFSVSVINFSSITASLP